MQELKPIAIGGRTFLPMGESTIEHDLYVVERAAKAGLAEVKIGNGESPEQFGRRLLAELSASGAVLDLLGALVIPAGTPSEDWTPELGRETAAFLGSRSSPEEKERVRGMILDLVIHFFANGMASLVTSATYSREDHPEGSEGRAAAATESGTG